MVRALGAAEAPRWRRQGVFAKLPPGDQEQVIDRANGKCHLCDRILELDGGDVAADHFDPRGPIKAANIYLAHGRCNSFRRDLDVPTARKLVRFMRFLEDNKDLTLDQVLDQYVTGQKRRSLSAVISASEISLELEEKTLAHIELFEDPSTKWKFFYVDIPVNYICNDTEEDVQPRTIKFSHVQKLLKDFLRHPVHEPPACRLVPESGGRYRLKMFDGQHKTAAQLALERDVVHVKVYVNPPTADVKSLIKSVQSTITKLPLSPGAFSKKMSKLHREEWDKFLEEGGAVISEAEFLKRFTTSEAKKAATADLIEAHISEAWHPEESEQCKIAAFVEPDNPEPGVRYPLKQPAFKSKVLRPLICGKPLERNDPEQALRALEARNVRIFLDMVTEVALADIWVRSKSEVETSEHRASSRFFQQGAMNGWVDLMRKVVVNLVGADPDEKERPFLREITGQQWEKIRAAFERIHGHSIWSVEDSAVVSAINQNKLGTSQALFEDKGLTFAYALGV